MVVCVSLGPLIRRPSRGVCDHAQTLWSLAVSGPSERVITIHPPALPVSRQTPCWGVWPLSLEASGLALCASCVSPILGHARALRTRVRFVSGLSLQRSLSPAVSLQRFALSSEVSLESLLSRGTSLARRATRLASRILSSVSSQSRVSPPSLLIKNIHLANYNLF